jgi:hypothetical protein
MDQQEQDPVEHLLTPAFASEDRTPLRQVLLVETTRRLRRRQRFKQLVHAASLLVCYLAGLGTMRLAISGKTKNQTDNHSQDADYSQSRAFTGNPQALTPLVPPIDQDPEVPANVLERIASVSEDKQSNLYRLAADRSLDVDNNVQAALRCYGRSLDTAKQEDLAISEDDNWLLMELKKARLEEKNHAQTGG